MRKVVVGLLIIFSLLPVFVFADCRSDKVTIVYINGVFGNYDAAKNDVKQLSYEYQNEIKNNNINFILGYNASHVGGLADLLDSTQQAYGSNSLDYDLTNILRQIHGELTTQKILLVGHSQGTFYTNAAYEYLVNHGVSRDSVSVYNVATPADHVAGNGAYLTSSTDKVISSLVAKLTGIGFAHKPLAPNINLPLPEDEQSSAVGGHSFSKVYLAGAPERIIGDINQALLQLKDGNSAPGQEGCFAEPGLTISHALDGAKLFALDQSMTFFKKELAFAVNTSVNTLAFLHDEVIVKTYGAKDVLVFNLLDIFKHPELFIASLTSANGQLAVQQSLEPPPDTPLIQLGPEATESDDEAVVLQPPPDTNQDAIDDILERIDILRAQLAMLSKSDMPHDAEPQDVIIPDIEYPLDTSIRLASHAVTGTVSVAYPQLLISEVQTAGQGDEKQEFVEVYNPTNLDVDLTGWYLQRKTKGASSFSTFAANTLFKGKIIPHGGYFLIARSGSAFAAAADLLVDNPLTADNTLALKNPSGDISDKVGWGLAGDYEGIAAEGPVVGKSIGRKAVAESEQDTDNNSADFGPNVPTPKAKNVAYSAPVVVQTDATAPSVNFNLNAKQASLVFSVDFVITDPFSIVSPSGIDGYVFRIKKESGDWQEDPYQQVTGAPARFSVSRSVDGDDETNYYFQVKTKDKAGNESDWQPENPVTTKVSVPKKVLINEIQIDSIAGTGGTNDDWVELYNPNNVNVDLSGWSIQRTPQSGSVSKKNFETGNMIPSHGYFLIVRNNAKQGLLDIADMTSSILQLSSPNGTVFLVRNQEIIQNGDDSDIIDKVGFGDNAFSPEVAPAPLPPEGKSIQRKKPSEDTDNNATDFKISDEPTPGEGFPKATIQDITDYSGLPSSSTPGSLTYPLLISWKSVSANIDFYDIDYRLNDGNWQPWLAHTAKTQEYFLSPYHLIDSRQYHFRVKATDIDGNQGNWSEILVNTTNPVVINEVAYTGTNASASDQWVELYNPSAQDVLLDGWKLVSGSNGQDSISLSLKGTILSKGYFMLEKGDDATLPDIPADQLFSGSIGSGYLYLRAPNNRYADQWYIPSFVDRSLFLKDGNYYSMERVSPASFGLFDKNWKLSESSGLAVKDRSANQVFGTPGAQNSVDGRYTYSAFSFIDNAVLVKEYSPYLFKGDVEVFPNVTLTIEPGIVVKFYDNQSELAIHGTLQAIGTVNEPIIFTSYKDDQYGGDTNGDGNDTAAVAGNWLGLYFSPESSNSSFEHVVVRYGGAVFGSSPLAWGSAIWVDHSSISVKNSLMEHNRNRPIKLSNSNSVVDGVTFSDNSIGDWPPGDNQPRAIDIEGGGPHITNSIFEHNFIGVYVGGFYDGNGGAPIAASAVIENNTFTDNYQPIYVAALAYPSLSGNQASGNDFNAIIFASDISQNTRLTQDLPYLVKNVLVVRQGIALTLDAGVIMLFQSNNSGLQIDGTLLAIGTQDNPVIFTSYYRDTAFAAPGKWLGIHITTTSSNTIFEHAVISYAGAFYGAPGNQEFSAAIKIDQSPVTVKNSLLQDNANNGMWLVNSPSMVDSVQFINHAASTLSLDAKGVYVQGGKPMVQNSHFKNNTYGIYVDGWHDPAGQDILGEPVLENNIFEASAIEDIHIAVFP